MYRFAITIALGCSLAIIARADEKGSGEKSRGLGADEVKAKPAMSSDELLAAQRLVRRLPVGESVIDAILALVRSARPSCRSCPDSSVACRDAFGSTLHGYHPPVARAHAIAWRAR